MAENEFQRFRRMAENTNDEMARASPHKAAWVEQQILQATLGNRNSIACPYCGSTVVWGVDKLCCKPMNDAAAIFLINMETKEFEVKNAGEPPKAMSATTATLRTSTETIQ